jgi:hypothetical protein
MHSSTALIAKLADYGTSVLKTNADGLRITARQFTTLENTPPDYLILGNNAKQGHCFGLGLCMLHLFTGHEPYEVILESVVCPVTLKSKLRDIWHGKSHDVIGSVMVNKGHDGAEVEDETLFNTLYRFLVLFGIPSDKFGYRKNAKVWRAISSTLLKEGLDAKAFKSDRQLFSLTDGCNKFIVNARRRLEV